MQDEQFRTYFEKNYTEGYHPNYQVDIFFRCKRVEKELAIDLDDVKDVSSIQPDLDEITVSDNMRNCLRSAVQRYTEFRDLLGKH